MSAFAQVDSTKTETPVNDTIKVGGMIIIRKKGAASHDNENTEVRIGRRDDGKRSNSSTNWWIFDLGFSNFTDNTDYTSSPYAVNDGDLDLRAGKSRNVNIWFFMQKVNIIKHAVNLKYGLGMELNNYYFDNTKLVFTKNPTMISTGTKDFKKVKLAADYLTLPVMLNFDFTPKRKYGFGFSAGVSAGYLYSARYKTKLDGRINKVKSDFDLDRWKFSYVGEISLGRIKLYGSYAMKNMWDKGLDMTPYNFGFRLSNW